MTRRFALFLALYGAILSIAAAVFDMAEGRDFANSLWWAVVTATTVGYGDLSPSTVAGRAAAILLMHVTTLLLMPLITAELAAKFIVDSDAFTHDEQEAIKTSLRRIELRLAALDPGRKDIVE